MKSHLFTKLVQTFGGMYSFYCDCAKFVHCLDMPPPPVSWDAVKKQKNSAMFAYIVSRGVEILDAENNTVSREFLYMVFIWPVEIL